MTVIDFTTRGSFRLGRDISGCTTVEEAMRVADLDWGLNIVPAENLTVTTEDGVTETSIPGMRLVMRDDSHLTLGVVGGRYEAVDNHNVFSLAQHFLDQGAKFTTGGSLDNGRRVFMRMDLPDSAVSLLDGKDLIKFGVVLRASHDGTGNVSAAVEGTRLICTNGMVAGIPGLPHVFNVRHTANVATRMEEARQILSGAARYANGFAAAAQHMLDTDMDLAAYKRFLDGLFPKPSDDEPRATTIWENRRAALVELFQFADTNDVGRGTAWAAYNSVTEFLDWQAPVRSTDGAAIGEVRARRQFDNTTQSVKDSAFSSAVDWSQAFADEFSALV